MVLAVDDQHGVAVEDEEDLLLVTVDLVVRWGSPSRDVTSTTLIPNESTPRVRRTSCQVPVGLAFVGGGDVEAHEDNIRPWVGYPGGRAPTAPPDRPD